MSQSPAASRALYAESLVILTTIMRRRNPQRRPVSSAASSYSEAVTATARRGEARKRQTTASSLFPYSTVRPPSNFSLHSLTDHPLPPLRHDSHPVDKGEQTEPETPYTGETPLYARSDWDAESGTMVQSPSAYSRSSYAGLTTAPPTSARTRHNTLRDIQEEDESESSEQASTASSDGSTELPYTAQDEAGKGWGTGEMVMSPEMLSASHSEGWTGRPESSGSWLTPTTGVSPQTQQEKGEGGGEEEQTDPFADETEKDTTKKQERRLTKHRRSSLPSVLELEDLTGKSTGGHGGFRRESGGAVTRGRSGGLDLLTPAAHQRLGRMSVAPARYKENPEAEGKSPGQTHSNHKPLTEAIKTTTGTLRFYQKWRPFIIPGLLLMSALLLTIASLNNPGPVSQFITAPAEIFSNPPRGLENVTFGVSGWCDPTGHLDCKAYGKGDFAAKNSVYNVAEDGHNGTFGDLFTALCALAWLTALYSLTHAFLHFYLFFSLNLPFAHLLDQAALLAPNGAPGKTAEQAEVDIRVRCEKPPFEGMEWVWWAWWAHRRSPVGHIFAVLTGVLALASFGFLFAFKNGMVDATQAGDRIGLGPGAFMPIVTFVCLLDPLCKAVKWCWSMNSEWKTFLQPPEPTTAAVMLPVDTKPVAHVRDGHGDSFYALRGTIADTERMSLQRQTVVPGGELDDETRRWLVAYPTDPDLVSLIASLRKGEPNEDFILSDVGLLYVRPGEDEPALLVPPKGYIREELLQDAHEEVEEGQEHQCAEMMVEILGETFWWDTMEDDVKEYVAKCYQCSVGPRRFA